MCQSVYGGQRRTFISFLCYSLFYILETESLTKPGARCFSNRAGENPDNCPASPGSSVFVLSHLLVCSMPSIPMAKPAFYVTAGDPNSGPLVCTVSVLTC